jgi:AraC-like DNA-binding protein/CheY-like chemotaxis protein
VTAGHEFLLRVLPLSHPESQTALEVFLQHLDGCALPSTQIDAILVRCLAGVDRSLPARVPTLVERYLASHDPLTAPAQSFAKCIEDLIRFRGVADPLVARAIALIDEQYADSNLRSSLSSRLGPAASVLSTAFRRTTGLSPTEYLRDVRLSQAAKLLTTSDGHVKDIWVAVGYNDDSNFNHDFKQKFGLPPGEYRLRSVPEPFVRQREAQATPSQRNGAGETSRRVLLVDDDVDGAAIIARSLRLDGNIVVETASAEQALHEVASVLPDVVLLDHRLGDGADGIECLQTLRRMRLRRQPAVALMTGDWDVADRLAELRALDATVMFRPCDLDSIHSLVATLAPP